MTVFKDRVVQGSPLGVEKETSPPLGVFQTLWVAVRGSPAFRSSALVHPLLGGQVRVAQGEQFEDTEADGAQLKCGPAAMRTRTPLRLDTDAFPWFTLYLYS